jgi:hypothetical protein
MEVAGLLALDQNPHHRIDLGDGKIRRVFELRQPLSGQSQCRFRRADGWIRDQRDPSRQTWVEQPTPAFSVPVHQPMDRTRQIAEGVDIIDARQRRHGLGAMNTQPAVRRDVEAR